MANIFKKIYFLALVFLLLLPLVGVLAGDKDEWKPGKLTNITSELERTGGEQGMGVDVENLSKDEALYKIIGKWVNWVTSFLGVVFTLLIIYGGWLWFSANGNEEKITQAKKIIINSVIALAIVLFAWIITSTVLYYTASASVTSVSGQ
ncbi:MAG: pilin [Patescibacteria group bacterium]